MERARKFPGVSLFETPAGFDDPLGMLLGCHRRIEKKLATLKGLCAHLARESVDAQASAAAQAVLRYFQSAAPFHHDDEEKDLFPMLEKRIADDGERARFLELREKLVQEHREMERVWSRLRKPLEGIADGLPRALPETDVQSFLSIYARHIKAEEAMVEALVQRWLAPADLETLGRAMASRRGVAFPF
jgi:pyridoxamine 5'-phosphate oxidase